jgi:hypothetical protein
MVLSYRISILILKQYIRKESSKFKRRENLLHSAHEISPRARLSSVSSSFATLRDAARRGAFREFFDVSAGIDMIRNDPKLEVLGHRRMVKGNDFKI